MVGTVLAGGGVERMTDDRSATEDLLRKEGDPILLVDLGQYEYMYGCWYRLSLWTGGAGQCFQCRVTRVGINDCSARNSGPSLFGGSFYYEDVLEVVASSVGAL